MVPGMVETVEIELLPTAARIPAGYRLRLAIAGHDAATFTRIPATGEPAWTIHRSAARPSLVTLPVRTMPE